MHPFQFRPDQPGGHTRMRGWESVDVAALSRAIGVNYSTLSKFLKGHSRPVLAHGRRGNERLTQLVSLALRIPPEAVEARIERAYRKTLP